MANELSATQSLTTLSGPLTNADLTVFGRSLSNLQANILKGHGRDFVDHVVLRFRTGHRAEVVSWLAQFAKTQVTRAEKQLAAHRPTNTKDPGEPLSTISFAADCYRYLGLPLPRDFDKAFTFGMKHATAALRDPVPTEWELPYQGEIHALVILADGSRSRLKKRTSLFEKDVQPFAIVLARERGEVIRDKKNPYISYEHFGYADGISQPVFFKDDLAALPIDKWNPQLPVGRILVQDPLGGPESFGSYLVFRKLEQRVGAFFRRRKELAAALSLTENEAGALAIGRMQDGTPLADVSPGEGKPREPPNNFNYDNDRGGSRCPFQAHIRKVNPRGAAHGIEVEEVHRIVRRGIPYGKFVADSEDPGSVSDRDRGLLFMCYQRSIRSQFEVLQGQWANKDTFPVIGAGVDPVIGQSDIRRPGTWPNRGVPPKKEFDFRDFVLLKGGEYFFTPSVGFLEKPFGVS